MPLPALIAAAGALGSTLLGMRSSNRANKLNHKYDDFNAQLALNDFNFNKDYTLNQYQYTADDMTKAGLNPLIMGSSAGSSSVSGGNVNTGSSSVADFSALGNLASSVLASKTQESVADKSSNTQKDIAGDNLEFSREKLKSDSEIRKQELQIERQNSQAQILKAQADVIKAQAETRNIDINTADTSYELEGRKSKGSFKDDGNVSKEYKSVLHSVKSDVKNKVAKPIAVGISMIKADRAVSAFDKLNPNKFNWTDKELNYWLDRQNLSDRERAYAYRVISSKLKR